MKCGDCHWFHYHSDRNKKTGQCFAYGFFMKPTDEICCDFARGRESE